MFMRLDKFESESMVICLILDYLNLSNVSGVFFMLLLLLNFVRRPLCPFYRRCVLLWGWSSGTLTDCQE